MSQYVNAEPFYRQDILRNLAIGFKPYLPFTQRYRLETNSDFAGRGTGYMAYGPSSEPSSKGETTGYTWNTRRNTYRGQGEGRLQYMSQYYGPAGRWNIAESVAPQESAARAGARALQIAEQLENTVGQTKVRELAGSPVPSRVVDEIGLTNLTTLLDKELTAQNKRPEDIYKEEVNRDMMRGAGYSSQGFDIHLEEHRVLAKYFSSQIGNFDENVRSAEITRARVSKAADKGLMNIRKGSITSVSQGKTKLVSHVGKTLTKLNKQIKDFVVKMTPEQRKRYDAVLAERGEFGALRTVIDSSTRRGGVLAPELPKMGLDELYKSQEWTAVKQFLDRGRRNQAMATELDLDKNAISHIYQNTMPNGYIGLTIMRQSTRNYKGLPYPFFMKPSKNDVAAIQVGVEGGLSTALASWAASNDEFNLNTTASALLGKAEQDVYGQAILGAGRSELVMQEAMTGAEFNIMDSAFNLRVGGINSTVKLVPTEIAKNLYDQILGNIRKNGSRQIQAWMQNLFMDANQLSKAWYDRMPEGMRASMSEEFQYGDDKGNPNKHFLGVWNKGGVGAWKGDEGQNISMAPFIIARRQKVANWRDGGFQEDR